MVISWLDASKTDIQQAAVSMLCRLGVEVVPLLIDEARCEDRSAKHSIAILDVVQQIGVPREPDVLFALHSLLGHKSTRVRAMAERIIMSTSPGGVPDSPVGLALMRAFNPFLQPLPRRRRPVVTKAEIRGFCHQVFGSPQRPGRR
jgi:hypothetical protein